VAAFCPFDKRAVLIFDQGSFFPKEKIRQYFSFFPEMIYFTLILKKLFFKDEFLNSTRFLNQLQVSFSQAS